jgi:hypothetical protein
MPNTHPNTPFGKFFDLIGVWHPQPADTIQAIIEKIKGAEPAVVLELQGVIALVKASLGVVPDAVFELLNLTREQVAQQLEELSAAILKIAAKI